MDFKNGLLTIKDGYNKQLYACSCNYFKNMISPVYIFFFQRLIIEYLGMRLELYTK
jgi:hypothetical protein